MSRDRAAYMRAYRAKDRSAPSPSVESPDLSKDERIAFLEGEVARLKRLLAAEPSYQLRASADRIRAAIGKQAATQTDLEGRWKPDASFRQFRPAPKPGK